MLKVLSWNILVQQWIDKKTREEALDKRHLRRSYRIRKQIEFIEKANPDVILLQETTPLVMRKYQQLLPSYDMDCFSRIHWQRGTDSDSKELSSGNAILWKKGLFTETSCKILTLDHARGIYASALTGRTKHGTDMQIINVHLSYGNVKAATMQFKEIIQKHLGEKVPVVIIGGDFNMEDDTIRQLYEKKGFHDCVPRHTPTHPFKSDTHGQTIDHILVKGMQCKATIVKKTRSIGECMKVYGSDHYPIQSTLIFQD